MSRSSSHWKGSRGRPSCATRCSSSSAICTGASCARCSTRRRSPPAPPCAPGAGGRAVWGEPAPPNGARGEERGARGGGGFPLVILTSPSRSLLRPLVDSLAVLQSWGDAHIAGVVPPVSLPRHWWQHIL